MLTVAILFMLIHVVAGALYIVIPDHIHALSDLKPKDYARTKQIMLIITLADFLVLMVLWNAA